MKTKQLIPKQAVFQSFKESEDENIKIWAAMSVEERFKQFDMIKMAFKQVPKLKTKEEEGSYIVLKKRNTEL